jgi:release factor glutamine methyltransferase
VTGWTIAEIIETASGYLQRKGSTSPRLDAELLLASALGMDRIHLYALHDRPLAICEIDHYRELIGRRGRHEPVAYIVNRGYFRRLKLELTSAVLIPRPETEELVDAVIDWLKIHPLLVASDAARSSTGEDIAADTTLQPAPLIGDVGTGSGAIALSLAQETGYRVLATDVSETALEVAAHNRGAHGLDGLVELRKTDLLAGVESRSLRVVVSNPPYISRAELAQLAPDVRDFEPLSALDGGEDGLDAYRSLLPQAAAALGPGGAIFLEVGHQQAEEVCALARETGFVLVDVKKDLSGKARIVSGAIPGAACLTLESMTTQQTSALVTALAAGAIVGVPTDTVYGLGAAWDSTAGVRRLFLAKGRAQEKPVAVLFSSVEAVREALPDLSKGVVRVLEALLPGPYTFIVSTSAERAPLVGDAESLGIRVPDCQELLQFLERLHVPLAATSANLTGGRDPLSVDGVEPSVLAHCAMALELASRIADPCGSGRDASGNASTVVDLRPVDGGQPPVVLREGAVSEGEVQARISALH